MNEHLSIFFFGSNKKQWIDSIYRKNEDFGVPNDLNQADSTPDDTRVIKLE